jgi:hypothetical protein
VRPLAPLGELTADLSVIEMRLHLALEYRGREVERTGLLIL